MTEHDLIESLKVHQFQPGDRLVVKTTTELPAAVAEHIQRVCNQWAPGVPVLVIPPDLEMEVVRGVPA